MLLLFYVLVFWPRGMWDLGSPTRDRTRTLCIGRRSLNHWTAREVPRLIFLICTFLYCITFSVKLNKNTSSECLKTGSTPFLAE